MSSVKLGERLGVKSKQFGSIWKSMFLIALGFPIKPTRSQIILFRNYYKYLGLVIPCKFCRDYIAENLVVNYPLDFSNRKSLLFTIYRWKDQVNKKLIKKGCKSTKPSPEFDRIYRKYLKYQAKCSKRVGKCI
jgi:Erv1 / Alr family